MLPRCNLLNETNGNGGNAATGNGCAACGSATDHIQNHYAKGAGVPDSSNSHLEKAHNSDGIWAV